MQFTPPKMCQKNFPPPKIFLKISPCGKLSPPIRPPTWPRMIFAPIVRTFAQFSFVQAHKKRVGNQVFSEKKILKSSAIHMNHIVQGTQIEIRNVKFITAQCGKTRNSLSRYIDKNFVKVMLLLIQCVEKYILLQNAITAQSIFREINSLVTSK